MINNNPPVLPKKKRQKKLQVFLKDNPFYTDEELAEVFRVSIQTIRLDRLALGIPEVRERIKSVAKEAHGRVRSLDEQEILGDLIDIKLGEYAISMLEISLDMVSEHKHVRGNVLFAQANSLAIAVIDSEIVLTGSARVRYKRPVLIGEKVVSRATIKTRKGISYLVSVHSKVEEELVFKGHFIMFAQDKKQL
ncbi:MAG: transcription factor FapR [Clostridia bacterium]|nr:transcription factor FapR [Clostridia bacterium]